MTPPEPVSIHDLIERYEVLLFDAYGVLVRSDGPIQGAPELITHLAKIGKPYYVLTNDASRQISTAAARYRACGLPIPDTHVITSGSLIQSFVATHALEGKPVMALGQGEAIDYVHHSGAKLVSPDQCDGPVAALFLCELSTTLQHDLERIISQLIRQIDAGHIPHLVLPNPDLIYPQSATKYGLTAGSMAAMFEAILTQRYPSHGLKFEILGKPHRTIYHEGLTLAGVSKEHAVMIGDQLPTDVRGALDFGMHAALVNTGLNSHAQLHAHPDCVPTYLLESLWP